MPAANTVVPAVTPVRIPNMACILVIPILLTGFVESIFPLMIALWIFGGSSLIAFAQFFVLNQVFANVQKAENIERA